MRRMISFVTHLLLTASVILCCTSSVVADTVGFDDLALASESFWKGEDGSGGFLSGDNWFNNAYNASWDSWDGFAYSNKTDTASTGMAGQFTAYSANGAGGGVDGSANYGVSYIGYVLPPQTYCGYMSGEYAQNVQGAYITNNAYAYHSMMNGDGFAKQFGGTAGDEPDWFKLTIEGLDANYTATGQSVDFFLADYRFDDDNLDYIVSDWTYVDLTSLGTVYGLQFSMSSSDVGDYGMNTPAYFAIDNLEFASVPEPGTIVLWLTAVASCLICGVRCGRK